MLTVFFLNLGYHPSVKLLIELICYKYFEKFKIRIWLFLIWQSFCLIKIRKIISSIYGELNICMLGFVLSSFILLNFDANLFTSHSPHSKQLPYDTDRCGK